MGRIYLSLGKLTLSSPTIGRYDTSLCIIEYFFIDEIRHFLYRLNIINLITNTCNSIFILTGSWVKPGVAVDVLDEKTGKWCAGTVKRLNTDLNTDFEEVNPNVVLSFLHCEATECHKLLDCKHTLYTKTYLQIIFIL